MRRVTHFDLAFTVRNGDRHLRTDHALQQQRRALSHFDQAETRFEAIGLVTHKARPGDDIDYFVTAMSDKIAAGNIKKAEYKSFNLTEEFRRI
jgi:hypothetical protein